MGTSITWTLIPVTLVSLYIITNYISFKPFSYILLALVRAHVALLSVNLKRKTKITGVLAAAFTG